MTYAATTSVDGMTMAEHSLPYIKEAYSTGPLKKNLRVTTMNDKYFRGAKVKPPVQKPIITMSEVCYCACKIAVDAGMSETEFKETMADAWNVYQRLLQDEAKNAD